MTRPAPTRAELRLQLAVMEEASRAFPRLSQTLEDGAIECGVLREFELRTLYEVPTAAVKRRTHRRGWERVLRKLPVVDSPSELPMPPDSSWAAVEVRGRRAGEPTISPCEACGGAWTPRDCETCGRSGKAPCKCREPQRPGCRKCAGTGLRRCGVCEGRGVLIACPACAGGGVHVEYEELCVSREIASVTVRFGAAVPVEFPAEWAKSLWRTEYRERGARIGLGAPELARGYRDAPVRALDGEAMTALVALLAGYAPSKPGAVVRAQEVTLRSLPFAGTTLPAQRGAFWLIGDERRAYDRVRRDGGSFGRAWAVALAAAIAGAWATWILANR